MDRHREFSDLRRFRQQLQPAGFGLVLVKMAVAFCYNCSLLSEFVICIMKSSVNDNWAYFLFRLPRCVHFTQRFWTFQLTLLCCVPNHTRDSAAPERRACSGFWNEEHAECTGTLGRTKKVGFQNNSWTQAYLLFCNFQVSV